MAQNYKKNVKIETGFVLYSPYLGTYSCYCSAETCHF